jgi:hypothetical protein
MQCLLNTVRPLSILLAALALSACNEVSNTTPTAVDSVSSTSQYLESDLHERVQQLKSGVRSTPTNFSNVRERAATLYEWANVFSTTKGSIPDELTLATSLGMNASQAANEARLVYNQIDSYVQELSLREEDPNAIGNLMAIPTGPFPADGYASFQQIYTIGSIPMLEGGGILVAMHALSAYPQSQVSNPAGDNYVTITSSNSAAQFEIDSHPVVGMYGGFRSARPLTVFRLTGTDLQAGETITLTYGDQSQGSLGYRMQTYSNDRAVFPLFVDLDGSDHFLTLPIMSIQISGTDVAGVHGFVPSIVATGESFTLSMRFQDRFANLALPPYPDAQILLNGEPFRTISGITEGITLIDDLSITDPGIYRFSFQAGDIEGVANPISVETNPENRIYWGDTHGHSGMAEGAGSADGYMRFARDEARLDYVTHSEHDIWLDDGEWEVLKENVAKYLEPGVFIPFLGYEWSQSTSQGGHHNVLFRTPEGRVRVPRQEYTSLSRLYFGLRNLHNPLDIVVIPHAHQAGEYRQSDPTLEHLIEIMSGHGTFEWFGRKYLEHGHRVGFIAASDDHLGHPGYSAPRGGSIAQRGGLGALFATEKTTDALFDAMKSSHAYATTGDRIILTTDVNGARMGTSTDYADSRTISGQVIGTAPIDTVTIIKNGEEIWSQEHYTTVMESDGPSKLQLTFYSDSDPYHPRDNPRGWRAWSGSLEVKNANLLSASATDHKNPDLQFLRVSEINENLIVFNSQTRGDTSSIDLVLDNVGAETVIELRLEAANEHGGAPQLFRRHGRTPAWDMSFALQALNENPLEETRTFQAWSDKVILRRVVEEGVLETEFEFTDIESPRQGDYYYVRVKQANDAFAWSSPTWVGGFGPN